MQISNIQHKTKKIKKSLNIKWAFIAFTLLFLSCQSNDESLEEQYLVSKIKTDFNSKNLEDLIEGSNSVDWASFNRGYSELLEGEFYEFKLLNKKRKNSKYISSENLFVLKTENQEFKYYILKAYQELDNIGKSNVSQEYFYNDQINYYGILQLLNKEKNIAFAIKKTLDDPNNQSIYYDKNVIQNKKENSLSARIEENCIEIVTYHYTEWYNVRPDGTKDYNGRTYEGMTTETVCNSYWLPDLDTSGGGGSGMYKGSGDGGVYEDCDDTIHGCKYDVQDGEVIDSEDQIINALTGKAKCIYNKLNSSSNGFKNAIKKFDGDFPVAHLKFTMKDLADNRRGQTSPPNNYVIEVALNNDSSLSGVNHRPNLLTAKTMIHEVIHAEMFRKLLSLASDNGNIDVNLIRQMLEQGDYPGMLDYYVRNGNIPNSNWQHQQMAAHYRETIARSLQEFDTGIVVDNNTQPDQLYLDLAWEGLNKSTITAWKDLTTQKEKDRVELVISNYINNNKNETCIE